MAICDSCKRLAAASKRADVPAHLLRIDSGSPAEGLQGHYRCLACQSRWRWVAPATWVLILPPVSATAARAEDKPAWWTTLGQILAGARPSRRGPIDLRPPRLTPRRPGSMPPPKPSASGAGSDVPRNSKEGR